MTLCLHVLIQQRFSHESCSTYQTFVRFFIRMNKSMCITVISAVERFTTHFTQKRFFTGMYATVFLKMLWIDKRSLTDGTFEGSFTSMSSFCVVIQQSEQINTFVKPKPNRTYGSRNRLYYVPSPLESLSTILTFVTFVIVMSGSFVWLQIGTLTESGTAKFTLVRSLSCVSPFVVSYFRFSSKSFSTQTTHKRFVTGVDNGMHFQIVSRAKLLS